MTTKTHLLEIYDADEYEGPNPMRVTGVGTVQGPENQQYYILEPADPVYVGGTKVTQFAVRPHYEGDAIGKTTDSVCTVGITMAKPGCSYVADERYGFADFCFWKVGKIHPCNGLG